MQNLPPAPNLLGEPVFNLHVPKSIVYTCRLFCLLVRLSVRPSRGPQVPLVYRFACLSFQTKWDLAVDFLEVGNHLFYLSVMLTRVSGQEKFPSGAYVNSWLENGMLRALNLLTFRTIKALNGLLHSHSLGY